MLSIVFGLIAICLGIWGMVKYWWYMVEVVIAILPLVLIFSGTIALLAGIKNTGLRTALKEESKKDEPDSKIRGKDE